jgi:DNA-binding NtrC family response regulator
MLTDYSPDSVAAPPNAVLVISARAEVHSSLRSIFRGLRWDLQGAWTVSEGLQAIRRNLNEIPVVICEHTLPDGDWKFLLTELDTMAVRPSLIVSSHLADERLWLEVLNLGAFDLLLGAPFEADEVARVTQSAWFAWNSTARSGAVPPMGAGPVWTAAANPARVHLAGNPV